jgi:hypothetical protein
VEVLTGFSNIHFAMSSFIDKFPTLKKEMQDELSQYHFDYERTKVFEKYYEKLMSIMKQNGVTGSASSKKKGLFGRKKTKKEQLPITKQEAYDILELLKALSELNKLR